MYSLAYNATHSAKPVKMFVRLVPVVKLRQEFCCLKYKPSQRMFLQLSISFVTYEWAQYAKMTGSFAFLQHPKIFFDRLMFASKSEDHPNVKHLLG